MLEVKSLKVSLGEMNFCFDLTLAHGEQLAILGHSGAGKSTLLGLIGGFLTANSGELLVYGKDILNMMPAKRPITTLFQDHNLFAHLSVANNVGLGLDPGLNLNHKQRALVSETLVQVGLEGYEGRPASKLSGGQTQRVALARCLIRNKPILLLDEPFSALDKVTRQKMLNLTKDIIREKNISALFVTHNEGDAAQFASRTIQISNGETVS